MANEQMPRVLSVDEIHNYVDVIIERKLYYHAPIVYAATPAGPEITKESEFASFIAGPMLPMYEYGSWWRCWDKRPTDEQRMAVEWDVHNV